jgi:hypothetical protein
VPLSRNEAETALRDISTAERASATTYGYRRASPYLVLWGVVWAVGYGVTYVRPQYTIIWPVLVALGMIASFWIGWKSDPAGKVDCRYVATLLAVFFFVMAVFAVLAPRTNAQISAFFPILVALFYSLIGIWTRGARMVFAGVVVAVLTIVGYFWFPQIFLLWMAAVGGGALILGGLWLRSA